MSIAVTSATRRMSAFRPGHGTGPINITGNHVVPVIRPQTGNSVPGVPRTAGPAGWDATDVFDRLAMIEDYRQVRGERLTEIHGKLSLKIAPPSISKTEIHSPHHLQRVWRPSPAATETLREVRRVLAALTQRANRPGLFVTLSRGRCVLTRPRQWRSASEDPPTQFTKNEQFSSPSYLSTAAMLKNQQHMVFLYGSASPFPELRGGWCYPARTGARSP